MLEVAKLTRREVEDVDKEKRQVVGAGSRHRRHDVSLGRSVGGIRRCCDGSRGIWRCWCGAAVRVCQTFSAPSCSV